MTALPAETAPTSFLVPDPSLREVRNDTPLDYWDCQKMGVGRRFYDTVVLKGTFTLAPGKLELTPQQAPVTMADEPWDATKTERSSLKRAGDVLLFKPTTDVLVTGTAHAPGGKPVPSWEASVEVRRGATTLAASRARVLGPRRWRHTSNEWSLTDPEPTAAVPIRYELAYGGAYAVEYTLPKSDDHPEGGTEVQWIVHRPNPSGTGFFDARTLDPAEEYVAPQWEAVTDPIGKPSEDRAVAGFGPVARWWSSRLPFAGTYDDAWLDNQREDRRRGAPIDYAADFDPRFFQCASPELITPEYLRGDEEIVLSGLVRGFPSLTLALPGVKVEGWALDRAGRRASPRMPVLDTVHVDLDSMTVSVCWRVTLPCEAHVEVMQFRTREMEKG